MSVIYKELKEREIRLLVIQPGDFDSVIVCDVIYTSIDNAREYDALSYVWGSQLIKHDILINGCSFTISQNLYWALKHFRALFNTMVLWVDAICINQDDEAEKGRQVQIMADIYRAAKIVRCWVGQYYEDTDLQDAEEIMGTNGLHPDDFPTPARESPITVAFALLQIFCTNMKHDIWNSQTTVFKEGCPASDLETMISGMRKTVEHSTLNKGWRFLQRIAQRPYWYRAWIQQEVICAHHAVVHCGYYQEEIIAFGRLQTVLHRCLSTYPRWDRPKILTNVDDVVSNMDVLITRATSYDAVRASKRGLFTQKGKIYPMLAQQYYRGASNLRDKVYGIAGLLEPWSDGRLVVSYTKSIREVYSEAFRIILEQSGGDGLQILCRMFRIPQSSRIDLPSWCPDLSHTFGLSRRGVVSGHTNTVTEDDLPFSLLQWSRGRAFSSAGKSSSELSFSECGRRLTCRGLVLGLIKHCSAELQFKWDKDFNFREQIHKLPMNGNWLEGQGVAFEGLWRTLCTDRPLINTGDDPVVDEAPESWGTVMEILCSEDITTLWNNTFGHVADMLPLVSRLPGGTELLPSMPRPDFNDWVAGICIPFMRAVSLATLKRRFIVSSNGSMGLVPIDAKVGDCVCIVFGCPLPLIMRPVADQYIFIGESYVHGYMDGQAMKMYEEGELEAKSFEII